MTINFKDIKQAFFIDYLKYWIIFFLILVIYFLNNQRKYLFETNNYITKNDSIYNINVLKSRLEKINQEIIRKNMGSATLSMALYNPKETIIFNAGDSRIYTYKNKTLNQETKDDSYVQCLYDQKIVKNKELMRFHKKSNLITNALGADKFYTNINIIPSDYDILLALTDGIT